MTKLNQIIALSAGIKGRAEKTLGDVYKKFQKPELFTGIQRNYTPLDDEGEQLPAEATSPKFNVITLLEEACNTLTTLFDTVITQEVANTEAVADIVVGEQVIAKDVPVGALLFLEKQMVSLTTLAGHIPTLDNAETWSLDPNTGAYITPASKTVRTKKIPRNHIKYEAVVRDGVGIPAQVEVFHEDVQVGTWARRLLSTAMLETEKNDIKLRITQLHDAIKLARESANMLDVAPRKIGESIIKFVIG